MRVYVYVCVHACACVRMRDCMRVLAGIGVNVKVWQRALAQLLRVADVLWYVHLITYLIQVSLNTMKLRT